MAGKQGLRGRRIDLVMNWRQEGRWRVPILSVQSVLGSLLLLRFRVLANEVAPGRSTSFAHF